MRQSVLTAMTCLKRTKPAGEKQLSMTIARIQTPEDADVALKAAELLQKHRAAREQHTPFRASTRNRMLMVRHAALGVA